MSTNEDHTPVRVRVSHPHSAEGGAKQDDRLSTNINTIVAQYQRSGTMPNVARRNPLYGDFTLIGDDLQDLTEMLDVAQDRFAELPSPVRVAAGNDYRKFIRMFDDPDGHAALVKAGLGVVDVLEPPAPSSAPVIPAPSPDPDPDPSTAAD